MQRIPIDKQQVGTWRPFALHDASRRLLGPKQMQATSQSKKPPGQLQVILGKEGQPIDLETYGEELLHSCEWGRRNCKCTWLRALEGRGCSSDAHGHVRSLQEPLLSRPCAAVPARKPAAGAAAAPFLRPGGKRDCTSSCLRPGQPAHSPSILQPRMPAWAC